MGRYSLSLIMNEGKKYCSNVYVHLYECTYVSLCVLRIYNNAPLYSCMCCDRPCMGLLGVHVGELCASERMIVWITVVL